MGDNSVFKQAQEAKLKTDIAKYQEILETAKGPIIIQGLGKFDKDKYFQAIQDQGVINNKEKDVIDNGDGTYDVTTKPGYVFLVTLIPSKENSTDAKIEYLGQAGKIKPIIQKIEVSATSDSITGKATVTRLGTNGTVEYYYKLKTAGDNSYAKITNVDEETGATVSSGITAGEEYTIKVVAKNDAGEVSDTKDITATKIFVSSVELKEKEVVAVTKSLILTATVLPTDATNKNVSWKSNNEAVATIDSETGEITGIAAGKAVITATATDGSEKSDTCEITVKSVSLNKTSETLDIRGTSSVTLTATVLPTDSENKNVTWSSDKPEIATVNNGVVTGIAVGSATITVSTTDENSKATASCGITVIKSPTVADIVGQKQDTPRTIKDENGNQVVIPDGFRVLEHGTETVDIAKVEYNYDTNHYPCVQDGIVAADSNNNQFVWIPVGTIKNNNNTTTTITLGRYAFDTEDLTTEAPRQTQANISESIEIRSYYVEPGYYKGFEKPAANLEKFIDNTNRGGGYWLGRYETSKVDEAYCTRKGCKPLCEITQETASFNAKSFKTVGTFRSDLINSYSWDTALIFAEKFGKQGYSKQTRILLVGRSLLRVLR